MTICKPEYLQWSIAADTLQYQLTSLNCTGSRVQIQTQAQMPTFIHQRHLPIRTRCKDYSSSHVFYGIIRLPVRRNVHSIRNRQEKIVDHKNCCICKNTCCIRMKFHIAGRCVVGYNRSEFDVREFCRLAVMDDSWKSPKSRFLLKYGRYTCEILHSLWVCCGEYLKWVLCL